MGNTIDEQTQGKILDFFFKYSQYIIGREKAGEWLKLHLKWGTIFITQDEAGEITSLCRWNIEDEGTTAKVLDFYIREDWRGKRLIQQFIERALHIFPNLKRISFERQIKYPGREFHTIPINRILQRS